MLITAEILLASVVFLGIIYLEAQLLYNYKLSSLCNKYLILIDLLSSVYHYQSPDTHHVCSKT